jgi:hypothetical protein
MLLRSIFKQSHIRIHLRTPRANLTTSNETNFGFEKVKEEEKQQKGNSKQYLSRNY